jgi:hypothetical protein
MEIFNANLEKYRIWVPKSLQKKLSKHFLRVELTSGERNGCFVTKINHDGRIIIHKEVREYLDLKPNDGCNVCIVPLKNAKRLKKELHANRFDVLAYVPEMTMSGFEILALSKKNKIYLWYQAKGRPNEIEVERFLLPEFARFLGYYQAEGGKLKLKERRGREFNFTNKSPIIVEDFIKLSKSLIDINLWVVTIRYNPKIEKSRLDDAVLFLASNGITREKLKMHPATRIRDYTFSFRIGNSILAELVSRMMDVTRHQNEMNFSKYFLQGLIAGDGCFSSNVDKNGSLHTAIRIFEPNLEYIRDYASAMGKFGIFGKFKKDAKKNFFIFTASLNWNSLLKIYELDLLKFTKHQNRLVKSIIQHKKYKSMKHLVHVPLKFQRVIRLPERGRTYLNSWLRDRTEEGILQRIDESGKNLWVLTKKGVYVKKMMEKIQYDLNLGTKN